MQRVNEESRKTLAGAIIYAMGENPRSPNALAGLLCDMIEDDWLTVVDTDGEVLIVAGDKAPDWQLNSTTLDTDTAMGKEPT